MREECLLRAGTGAGGRQWWGAVVRLRDGCGGVVAGLWRGGRRRARRDHGVGHGVTMARNRLCISDIAKPRAVFGEHAHE